MGTRRRQIQNPPRLETQSAAGFGHTACAKQAKSMIFRGVFGWWRRGRDSNPRYHRWYTPLAGERLRPLGHLSGLALVSAKWRDFKGFLPLLHNSVDFPHCSFACPHARTCREQMPPAKLDNLVRRPFPRPRDAAMAHLPQNAAKRSPLLRSSTEDGTTLRTIPIPVAIWELTTFPRRQHTSRDATGKDLPGIIASARRRKMRHA